MRLSNRTINILRYTFVGAWVGFTISLAGWWYIFAVEQTSRIVALESHLSPAMTRHITMLKYEGAALFICLLVGGAALAYYMFHEARQKRQLKAFFATFTHELKTPLASLRLQAESLREDLSGSPHAQLADRLISDTQRLALQLENSLFLADEGLRRMMIEPIALRPLLEDLHTQWPGISLVLENDATVQADARALECILRNIIQNSLVHGHASTIHVHCSPSGKDSVRITVKDNGTGFSGDARTLGKLFGRSYPGSGNGIGLYLVRKLARRMGGSADFLVSDGFCVELELRGDTTA